MQKLAACPHCGSHQLVAHQHSRKIYIDHAEERIPLLTVNFNLDHPVMEEHAITYTCSCSWAGGEAELT